MLLVQYLQDISAWILGSDQTRQGNWHFTGPFRIRGHPRSLDLIPLEPHEHMISFIVKFPLPLQV
jgi:hypothetical protein